MKDIVQIFKALGDETRLAIVKMLVEKELCVCDIMYAFNVSQPAISHHLKILKQAEIIIDEREGKWIFYRLNAERLEIVQEYLSSIVASKEIKRFEPSSPNRL